MIDHAIGLLRCRLTDEEIDPDNFEMVVGVLPISPWIVIDFEPIPPVFDEVKSHHFALWKRTGVIHEVIDGEVQDPPIFTVPS